MKLSADQKLALKIKKLFAYLGSASERDNARTKLDELLAQAKKSWNDMPELLALGKRVQDQLDAEKRGGRTTTDNSVDPDSGSGSPDKDFVRPAPLDLIRHILERHVHLTAHQFVAVSLWIA